jgi:hypothetical protein
MKQKIRSQKDCCDYYSVWIDGELVIDSVYFESRSKAISAARQELKYKKEAGKFCWEN